MACDHSRSIPLLSKEYFAEIFEPLRGKRVGLVTPFGNVGDQLITWATGQLLEGFQVDWDFWDSRSWRDQRFDELLYGGGGNMGELYQNNWRLRDRVFACDLPVTILPQSFTSPEQRAYKRVFVRETASLALCPEATLAPDLALGLSVADLASPVSQVGIFLRRDSERTGRKSWLFCDPARVCRNPRQYLELAAKHKTIVTDRLHFAICGLIAGREVILVSNSYHKNRAMYNTWLKHFGCRYAETVREAYSMLDKDYQSSWSLRNLLRNLID